MRIDASFPGGRVAVVAGGDPSDVRLSIPADAKAEHYRQWFSFALCESAGTRCAVTLVNAGECTWARGFGGAYRVHASEDGETWFRVPTTFDGKVLGFCHTPKSDRVLFAYFTPYDATRVDALVARVVAAGVAEASTIATTAGGVAMPVLTFGASPAARRHVWIIAQQHPGESQAGWFIEGLVARLGAADRKVQALTSRAVVHVVPRMNPDGCALGNHRTNGAGIDLNRQWLEPEAGAPEVAGVRAAMLAEGCDLFLDAHGDEIIPHVFAHGTDGVPKRSPRLATLEKGFAAALLKAAAPDFQTKHGYPKDRPGQANLRIASNWVASAFDCLSLTLEMPFTDHLDAPDPEGGWSAERSARLGARTVDAIAAMVERGR